MIINFLYGNGYLALNIPDQRLKAVLLSRAHEYKAEAGESELIRLAVENPIGSCRLREMVKGRNNIVFLASDHTRPVPSRIILPAMIEEIWRGNPEAKVTVLISTGCHRAPTKAELENKFGAGSLAAHQVFIHDCDHSEAVKLGCLPSGIDLILNKLAVEADLLVSEGFIEPHFFAGFSGGRKSVFPGITNRQSVMANHCSEFIAHPRARTGLLDGNPIHADMVDAACQAKLAFIVNAVIDSNKKVIKAFAGHFDQAHRAGADFVSNLAGVEAAEADIVIATNGGYPLDQNLYQAVKGLTAAEATVKPGGVIIMAARCEDGHGGESFLATFQKEKNLKSMMAGFMARPAVDTIADQWQSQILARVLMKAHVIMVTEAPGEIVEDLHMRVASSLPEAVNLADEILGHNRGQITALPDGIGVIVT